MDTNLRSFRRDDADQVVALARQAYARPEEHVGNPIWPTREELESEISDWDPPATETLLVAEDGDGVVGIGGVEAGGGSPEVADLFGPVVAKRAQGRRLGSRLLAESIALARAHGASVVDAAIGTRNRRGRVLLERNGFAPRGRAGLLRASPAGSPARPALAGGADRAPRQPGGRGAGVRPLPGVLPDGASPRTGSEPASTRASSTSPSSTARRWLSSRSTAPTAGSTSWGSPGDARGRGIGGFLLSRALESLLGRTPGRDLGLATEPTTRRPSGSTGARGSAHPPLQPYELVL